MILQFSGKPSGRLNALLNRNDVHVRAHFENFNVSAVELPASVVQELASFSEVSYVSFDREVDSLGHVETTTGALATRTQQSNLDGRGVTIAVLDSSIYNGHVMFAGTRKSGRILANVDFVCPTCRTADFKDMYGHGTHVAGLLAGNDSVLAGAYQGIAPRANLVNLRVLDDKGTGKVSTVLGALNWVMTNRALYNIRVVNMSIGTPAIDSFKDDPLCKAVRRLVDAGVVVVAAAGNDGKNASGQKIYGAIHSPGNEPSAITVG
ncbi:MAG TPA: S8 family serine peptidase, partial [Pyrinomonadaceae bacterium]|nr:S8 family serine peptidase [Pyrinomonadaceae bacterium]